MNSTPNDSENEDQEEKSLEHSFDLFKERKEERAHSTPDRKRKELDGEIDREDSNYSNLFPTIIGNLEVKLFDFIQNHNKGAREHLDINPCQQFAISQLLKIARSLYRVLLSKTQKLTSHDLNEINEKIENLIAEQQEQNLLDNCDQGVSDLRNVDQDLQTYINQNFEKLETHRESKNITSLSISKGEKLYNIYVHLPKPQVTKGSLTCFSEIDPDSHEMPQESDFEIIKLISQGAYGAVYLVRHNLTKQRFAMKKILKSRAILKNQVRQIFAERDILSFVDNPFVISMFCSFETQNAFCMIMEYAEGGDCASLLRSIGILPLKTARVYIAETIVALDYIHNYGIIHRDIKPDNLLITSLGHIKLTDFGLSKVGLMDLTVFDLKEKMGGFKDKMVLGTPNYIAPEVILNKPYGRVVDYWSTGVVLYEFLVGCTPFFGSNVDEIFNSIISGPIEWPQGDESIDPDAQDIILKLLERDPKSRGGSQGAGQIKSHKFFSEIQWDDLIHTKLQFIPTISDDFDTSGFDDRSYRYHHHETLSKNDSEASSYSNYDSPVFDSFTRRFTKTIQDKRATLKSSIDGESCSYSNDISLIDSMNNSGLSESTPKNYSSFIDSLIFIPIQPEYSPMGIGFSIKTVRVLCYKNITFLLHLVDQIIPNSYAEKMGLSPGMVIIYLNDHMIVGKQHIQVIKYISNVKLESIAVCCLDDIGVTMIPESFGVFQIESNNTFFKYLIHSRIIFEKVVDNNYMPVKLDLKGDVERCIDKPFLREKPRRSSLIGKITTKSTCFDRNSKQQLLSPSPNDLEEHGGASHYTFSDERIASHGTYLGILRPELHVYPNFYDRVSKLHLGVIYKSEEYESIKTNDWDTYTSDHIEKNLPKIPKSRSFPGASHKINGSKIQKDY